MEKVGVAGTQAARMRIEIMQSLQQSRVHVKSLITGMEDDIGNKSGMKTDLAT